MKVKEAPVFSSHAVCCWTHLSAMHSPCSLSGTCSTPLCWGPQKPHTVDLGGQCCGWPELTDESAQWTGVDSRPALMDRWDTDRHTQLRPSICQLQNLSYIDQNHRFVSEDFTVCTTHNLDARCDLIKWEQSKTSHTQQKTLLFKIWNKCSIYFIFDI